MKKLFCLAVLSCVSFVGCAPTTPAGNTKPADSNPAGSVSGEAAKTPADSAPTETPNDAAPPAEAPK